MLKLKNVIIWSLSMIPPDSISRANCWAAPSASSLVSTIEEYPVWNGQMCHRKLQSILTPANNISIVIQLIRPCAVI